MARIIKANEMKNTAADKAAVLNLTDLAAQARDVVLEARKQACEIISEANAKAEQLRLQAHEQAYKEGLAKGHEEGFSKGRLEATEKVSENAGKQADEIAALAKKAIGKLNQSRAKLLQDAHSDILDLAIMLAEKIVAQVSASNITAAKENLAKVLELANCPGEMVIKVNPAQFEQLNQYFSELVRIFSLNSSVQLVGDESISAGGAKLISGQGTIDATIETQLANVVESLLGRKSPNQSGTYESEVTFRESVITNESA